MFVLLWTAYILGRVLIYPARIESWREFYNNNNNINTNNELMKEVEN